MIDIAFRLTTNGLNIGYSKETGERDSHLSKSLA